MLRTTLDKLRPGRSPALRRSGRVLAAATAAALVAAGLAGAAEAETKLLNVSYDPTRELYQDYNAAFNAHWQAEGHAALDIEHVARRLRRPGPRGDRRPRGAGRDAGARQRHRRHRREVAARSPPTGRASCRTTPRPTPRPSCSWCARATPRASRTGTTWSSDGIQVITPNPKTSGGARWNYLAAWAWADKEFGGNQDASPRLHARALRATCPCSTPARAARRRPSRSAASATCCSPGRTRPTWRTRSSARTSSTSSIPSISILAEPTGGARRRQHRRRRAAQGRRGLPRVPLQPRGPGDRRAATSTAPGTRAPPSRPTSHASRARPRRRSPTSAAGPRCSRNISATAASSTKSTRRSEPP